MGNAAPPVKSLPAGQTLAAPLKTPPNVAINAAAILIWEGGIYVLWLFFA
jgi:hypothetical protein